MIKVLQRTPEVCRCYLRSKPANKIDMGTGAVTVLRVPTLAEPFEHTAASPAASVIENRKLLLLEKPD
jgi:hypothetical protein